MSRANRRMREALFFSSLVLGSGFLGLNRGAAQESGMAKPTVPVRPLTLRRVPPADTDPLLTSASESDIAKMKKEIAALQAEIARLKAASQPTAFAVPQHPENVLIQRKIEPPAGAAFQAGKIFTIRVEKAPGQQEECVIVGMNLPGAYEPLIETAQGTPTEEALSAKKLEAIHEGFKNLPPSVRQKVIEAFHAAGAQPVRIQVSTAPAAPTPTILANPVQPSVFYHPHATPTAAPTPVQGGVLPPHAVPMPPSVTPHPVTAPIVPTAPAPIRVAQPAPSGEIEQKLNQILEKLDNLEKRLESRKAFPGSAHVPAPPIHEPTATPSGALPVIYPANPVDNR